MTDLDYYAGLPGPSPPEHLLRAAVDVLDRAYSPYSTVQVGVAVATGSGEVHVGANIENASYSATICAERVALTSAVVAEGQPLTQPTIVVVGRPDLGFSPCGICRQVISELAPDATVFYVFDHEWQASSVPELLPHGFSL
ncbi:MAG: cytidine deaminase [Acidimicrobiia bacterium]|nr:cytidine deaminase [Acidimicrobiia bacterium]